MTSKTIEFTKMSGAGNDFLVIGPHSADILGKTPDGWIRQVCRRRHSVGGDGVLIVRPVGSGVVEVRHFNADGSEAFCGNGARCAARFSYINRFAGAEMTLATAVGMVPAEVTESVVRVKLPPPVNKGRLSLSIGDESIIGKRINAGVPHFVVEVESVSVAPLERWGPQIRRHEAFGEEGTNLDLISRTGDRTLEIRTWERGVEGETLACGTGAVAAAVAAAGEGCSLPVSVLPRSGEALVVNLMGSATNPESAILEGDARIVFEGKIWI